MFNLKIFLALFNWKDNNEMELFGDREYSVYQLDWETQNKDNIMLYSASSFSGGLPELGSVRL